MARDLLLIYSLERCNRDLKKAGQDYLIQLISKREHIVYDGKIYFIEDQYGQAVKADKEWLASTSVPHHKKR